MVLLKKLLRLKLICLLILISIISCKQDRQINGKEIIYVNKSVTYALIINDSIQHYYKQIGNLSIQNKSYSIINYFKKVHAAILWHGQSKLIFCGQHDTVSYIVEMPGDFPDHIADNKLAFGQSNRLFTVDSLAGILCLPTGCIEKDLACPNLIQVDFDSMQHIF